MTRKKYNLKVQNIEKKLKLRKKKKTTFLKIQKNKTAF